MHMIAISNSLMRRISADFSYLSAIWPAVAENSMNGTMKMAPIRLTIIPASIDVSETAANATNTTNAFLKTLSLAAARNCVQKKGAKRRCRSRSNWFGACMGRSGVGVEVTLASREAAVEIIAHGVERRAHGVRHGPIPDFLADLLAAKDPCLTKNAQVVGDSGS